MEASGNDSDDEESEVSDEEDREKAKEDEKSAEIGNSTSPFARDNNINCFVKSVFIHLFLSGSVLIFLFTCFM